MKLLIVTSRFPYPLEKGDKLRLYYQIKLLSQKNEIVLLSLADEPVASSSIQHLQQYCSKIHFFPIKKIKAYWNTSMTFFNDLPLEVGFFYDKKIKKQIHKIINSEKPDHIFCQLIRTSEYVRELPFPKTIDYMDAFSIGMERRAENSKGLFKWLFQKDVIKLSKYEAAVFHDFDYHTIISNQDKEHLQVSNNQQIQVVPNGVDTDFFMSREKYLRQSTSNANTKDNFPEYDIGFVGNMGYYPNVQAAKFIVKEILPRLQKKYPNIKILIAGARPTAEVKQLENKNVIITGWVEDIRDAYASIKLFVAPIFWGRGQQNKILEAMSMGIPCITTSQVNNAIGAEEGNTILLANSSESWVKQISLLLENDDLQNQFSKKGRIFIKDKFSWEYSVNKLEQIFLINDER